MLALWPETSKDEKEPQLFQKEQDRRLKATKFNVFALQCRFAASVGAVLTTALSEQPTANAETHRQQHALKAASVSAKCWGRGCGAFLAENRRACQW